LLSTFLRLLEEYPVLLQVDTAGRAVRDDLADGGGPAPLAGQTRRSRRRYQLRRSGPL